MILTPPTDNLYKFCAILGLVLIVFNSYYNFEMAFNTEKEISILEIDLKKTKFFVDKYNEDVEVNNQAMKYLISFLDKNNKLLDSINNLIISGRVEKIKSDKLNEFIDNKQAEYKSKIDDNTLKLHNDREKIFLNFIESEKKSNLIKIEIEKLRKHTWFLFAGGILGIFLSFFGFYNWYKIQKLNDKSLIHEINKKTAN